MVRNVTVSLQRREIAAVAETRRNHTVGSFTPEHSLNAVTPEAVDAWCVWEKGQVMK